MQLPARGLHQNVIHLPRTDGSGGTEAGQETAFEAGLDRVYSSGVEWLDVLQPDPHDRARTEPLGRDTQRRKRWQTVR